MNAGIQIFGANHIRALERKALRMGRRFNNTGKEVFDEAVDFLHDLKQQKEDYVIQYKIRNFKKLLDGFDRVIDDVGGRGVGRPKGLLRAKLKTGQYGDYALGIVSPNVITDTGVAALVDILQAGITATNLKFHGSGTNNASEAAANTALGTEVESRASGTNAEGATGNIYRSVGTQSYTDTRSIVEHGLFTASTTGVLFDRSVFSSIGVLNGDSIEWTYECTFSSGG